MSKTALNASFEGKKERKLPKGAIIVSEKTSVNVEEIENGFITTKSTDYEYKMKADEKYSDYMYISKKYYSQTNPLTIDLKLIE